MVLVVFNGSSQFLGWSGRGDVLVATSSAMIRQALRNVNTRR